MPTVSWDIFVHDLQAGVTEFVSVDSSGVQANADSGYSSISGDGRCVVFESAASNLVPGDTNGWSDVFVHDRQTGITERASVDFSGVQAELFCITAAISGNGRYVSFNSFAANLVPFDSNETDDVFVHDRKTTCTEIVSVSSSGLQGNERSTLGSLSADGRYLGFTSWASNLVAGDTNGAIDVFLRDRRAARISRATALPAPRPAAAKRRSPLAAPRAPRPPAASRFCRRRSRERRMASSSSAPTASRPTPGAMGPATSVSCRPWCVRRPCSRRRHARPLRRLVRAGPERALVPHVSRSPPRTPAPAPWSRPSSGTATR